MCRRTNPSALLILVLVAATAFAGCDRERSTGDRPVDLDPPIRSGAAPEEAREESPDAAVAAESERRGDLARFVGEYGTVESAERGRTFWVVEHCEGYLVAGAMWGDASPWQLEAVSETTFEQRVFGDRPGVRLEFGTGSGGTVESLRILYDGSPLLEEYPSLQRLREEPPGLEGDCWQGYGG